MGIEAGRELLHYRIVEKIGEGGMGVVWRALDTTLGREVAIKVLPDAVSADAERVLRFEREARLLAALNHPHIATIHGMHSATTAGRPVHFLALELVEGQDLEQILASGPLPLDRAIEVATQVATALEAAHAQGIVHRDLKPANVKLNASGDVKVLDFGLAKALSPESASGGAAAPSMSPTLTSAGTLAGMILGTAAYMSPEQARGSAVDKRADLWAFGCLLYEMLTAQRCFAGDTISDTLASVLKEQPDWARLPGETPPPVRRLLRRCLTKDPRQRLSDAADARMELREAFETHETIAAAPGPAAVSPVPASKLPWVVAAIATVVAVAAVGAWLLGRDAAPVPRDPVVLSIPIPPDIALRDDQESLLELSPDGRHLVFSGFVGDSSANSLYLRALDDATIVKLPDTAGAVNPFFSPDGRWVGFFADGRLKKIQIDGTTAITICAAAGNPRGASWGADDRIVFPAHFAGALQQVRAAGGEPTALTELDVDRKERTHRWPHVVPGHDVVLFTAATTDSPEFYDDARIDAVRLSTGERKTVFEGASFARYVPTGHLVFGRAGFLYGVPFDIDRLETTGQPTPIVEGVTGAANSGVVYASVADNGLLAYVPGRPENPRSRLHWLYADGRTEPLDGADTGGYFDTVPSPDGRYAAVTLAGERLPDIWVFDLERQSRVRLTFEGENSVPVWTPDGQSLVFSSTRNGVASSWITAADGSGGERMLNTMSGVAVVVTDVSPDGRLAIMEVWGDNKPDIHVKALDDPAAEAVPFLTGPAEERSPRFSADGRWVVYVSDESGEFQVFVRPYPGPGGRWQISNRGGIDPRWSRDGRQIHYRVNREWWVVDVDTGDGAGRPFRTDVPRLVRNDLPRVQLQFTNGLSPDSDAILVPIAEDVRGAAEEIRVVVDWFDELERLVAPEG